MEPYKDLKTMLNEAMDARNFNHEKLSQLTGIPEHFLRAIENLDPKKLPASPYVRGYLKKISTALHLNQEELWKLYERELAPQSSGEKDRLPINRFAIQSVSKKVWAGGALGIALIVFLAINLQTFFSLPMLEITTPDAETVSTALATINLIGHINPKDKITINGEEALADASGSFQLPYNLQLGLNTIEFKVKRFLGKEKVEVRHILYQSTEEKPDSKASTTIQN